MPLFSVVISPPDAVISQVARIKQQLEEVIGFYPSCHSLAHITFNLFLGNEATLTRWERYLHAFTANLSPLALCFNETGYFANGAFFFAPDAASKSALVPLMKSFFSGFPAAAFGKSTQPHISIGRQLDPDQLTIARALITNVDISFVCDNLAIRKFDEQLGQYALYKRFAFTGKDLFSDLAD